MPNYTFDDIEAFDVEGDYGPCTTRDALVAAYNALALVANPAAQDTIAMILRQRGSEHLDPAVTDGYLTHYIDIAVFG